MNLWLFDIIVLTYVYVYGYVEETKSQNCEQQVLAQIRQNQWQKSSCRSWRNEKKNDDK